MHFEVLVEDLSGKKALKKLIPKIIGSGDTYKIYAYKGVGHIPKNIQHPAGANNHKLFEQLPRLLQGYGKTFAAYPNSNQYAVIVVCDLDKNNKRTLLKDLSSILQSCNPKPETRFCLAVEEGEAWLLGDIPAIKAAYPRAKDAVLNKYVNDSICGTWELLADAIYRGGHKALAAKGWQAIGAEKSQWAEKITPHMTVKNNLSSSFKYFQTQLQ
jgi:hypothetical protein